MRRPLGILLAGIVAASGLSACTSGPSADDVATDLAAALSRGEAPAELVGEPAQADLDAVLEDVSDALREDATARVRMTDVREDGDTAEAALTWAWDLDGSTWEYDTTAALRRGDDGWTVTWERALVEPTLTDSSTLRTSRLTATRGDILGAGGRRIVTERDVVRFGLDKTKVPADQVRASARRIATVLDLTPGPFVKAAVAAGPKAFVEAVVLRPDDALAVPAAYADIPGAVRLAATLPLAPTREFAAPLLGRVGPVTAELVEESEGRLAAGDVAGLSGLQARYDEQLAGTPGFRVLAVSGDGTTRELFRVEPVAGEPLRLSLDVPLQTRAERVVAGATAPTALVAVRPSDGAVLAAATGAGDGQNLATFGQYAPGSTFKIVSALALLRSGLTPESAVSCPARVVVNGKAFENYDDYPAASLGRVTLREAFAQSCNTAFIGQRDRLRGSALADAAAALGFGVDHDLGFPAYFGQVPPPAGETEAAAALIGQGKVLASPLAMATVAASVAAGRTVVPHLVDGIAPTASPSVPLTAGEARRLRSLMGAVVREGSGAALAPVGVQGAKTGTAEYGAAPVRTHAWMVAFRGDLAVAAFVETGESGSRTAGPLLRAFLSP